MTVNCIFDISIDQIRWAYANGARGINARDTHELLVRLPPERVNDKELCFRTLDRRYPNKWKNEEPPPDMSTPVGLAIARRHRNYKEGRAIWFIEHQCTDRYGLVLQLRSVRVPRPEWDRPEWDPYNPAHRDWSNKIKVYYVTRHGVVVSWYTPESAEARCMFARVILETC